MEADTISKNGRSLKSHTSRESLNFYKLTALGIFVVMLFLLNSCNGDEPVVNQQDVTIEWGRGNIEGILVSNIQIYLAKPETKNVILESDGKGWNGMPSFAIVDMLKPAFDLDSKRVKGKGNIKNVTIKSEQDSLLFVGWGYTVNKK